jgi:2-polyprenyl-3-methyl-5-hydroxy-6-metoxy-1,4-benzoquinol methylase
MVGDNGANEAAACAACGGLELRNFMELTDAAGRPAELLRCRRCRLVQVAALPSDAEITAHYARYSYDQAGAWEVPAATAASLHRLSRRLERYRSTGRVLDVGCGAGAVMRLLNHANWTCEGLEVSDLAAARLRREGFVVHVGTMEALAPQLGHYDLVIMSETIEHVRSPRLVMQSAAGVIRPGGALYLTTPHVDSLSRRILGARWRPIEVPEHLFYFETRSMRRLLRSAGLTPMRIWTDGFNPFEVMGSLRPRSTAGSTTQARTEALRDAAVRSRPLSFAKGAVNAVLRTFGLGDTLKAIAEAPPSARN